MKHVVVGALLTIMVAGASRLPVAPVHASTVQGSAVTISGLDDLAATADQQARRGAGKIIAMVLGMGGLATVLSGRIGLGLAGVGAGMGMGFVPSMMSSAFDALALRAAGVSRVVAIFGMHGWRWDWVREIGALVFALDADTAGQH